MDAPDYGPLFSGVAPKVEAPDIAPKAVELSMSMAKCRFCLDTGYVLDRGRYKPCTCKAGAKNALLQICASLSDGTFATLTGYARYDQIEPIRNAFLQFVTDYGDGSWNWSAAWNEFKARNSDLSVYVAKPIEAE